MRTKCALEVQCELKILHGSVCTDERGVMSCSRKCRARPAVSPRVASRAERGTQSCCISTGGLRTGLRYSIRLCTHIDITLMTRRVWVGRPVGVSLEKSESPPARGLTISLIQLLMPKKGSAAGLRADWRGVAAPRHALSRCSRLAPGSLSRRVGGLRCGSAQGCRPRRRV